MAVETYPSFLQDEEYSAETLRHVFGTLLARGSAIGSIVGGLVASTDMQVTAGSGMQVLVATGEAWIPGTSVSTQGGYLGRVTSSTALAISAASESNPRIETIIAQVQDKAVAGGTDSFSVSVVVGTATSGATLANKLGAGSVPASSLILAYVLVPSKAVSIVSGDIENVAKQIEAPSTTVGEKALKAEAVTDAKVVKGRALVETENAYSAPTARTKEVEYEPSSTRMACVTVSGSSTSAFAFTAFVGGVEMGQTRSPTVSGVAEAVLYFLCPPKVKWKVVTEATTIESSYLLL